MTTAAKADYLDPQPIEFGKTLFKVLKDGKSFHGGSLAWSLPTESDGKHKPGEWHEVAGGQMCNQGVLHVTLEPARWYADGAVVYIAECDGKVGEEDDKHGYKRVRLIRPLTPDELPQVCIYLVGDFVVDKGFHYVSGNCTVRGYGNCTMRGSDNCTMEGSDNCTMRGSGNCTMRGYGNCTMRGYDNCTMEGYGNCTMRGSDNCTMEGYGNCTMRGYDNCTMEGSDNCTMRGYDNCTMEGYGNCTMEGSDNCTMEGYDNCTMRGSGNCTMRGYGNCTMEGSDNCTMEGSDNCTINLLWGVPVIKSIDGNAVVIDRRTTPPTVTCAWQKSVSASVPERE